MSQYLIRDIEKLSGIKAHTIRIWEKRYNVVCPKRTSTNIRFYSDDDLKKLLNISILYRNGYKISKIACLKNEELTNQVYSIYREPRIYESPIESLIITMIDMDEKKFEELLSDNIMQLGFEETILKVVYLFFIRIGLMWQTGNISPAQEHFISNLIRQKIIVAIDGVITEEKSNKSKFILFLPEGELHEIALLFMYYMIKKRGHKVIYLGQSVPVNDVREVQNIINADYLITYFTSSKKLDDLSVEVKKMSELFNNTTLIVAGNQTDMLHKIREKNVKRIASLEELIEELENPKLKYI